MTLRDVFSDHPVPLVTFGHYEGDRPTMPYVWNGPMWGEIMIGPKTIIHLCDKETGPNCIPAPFNARLGGLFVVIEDAFKTGEW